MLKMQLKIQINVGYNGIFDQLHVKKIRKTRISFIYLQIVEVKLNLVKSGFSSWKDLDNFWKKTRFFPVTTTLLQFDKRTNKGNKRI